MGVSTLIDLTDLTQDKSVLVLQRSGKVHEVQRFDQLRYQFLVIGLPERMSNLQSFCRLQPLGETVSNDPHECNWYFHPVLQLSALSSKQAMAQPHGSYLFTLG